MQLLLPTTFEQRVKYYTDVDALLSVGFLSHTVKICGVNISLRSLCPGDMFLLRSRIGGDQWELGSWVVASSIWMINGYNLLEDHNPAYHIHEFLKTLPKPALEILFSISMGLFDRQNEAYNAVVFYAYESISRYKWRSLSSLNVLFSDKVPGVEKLGVNPIYQMWKHFNEVEDASEKWMCQWEAAKLVASATSPKGVQKLYERDDMKRQSEENRRKAELDKFYYRKLGVRFVDGDTRDGFFLPHKEKTDEDLEQEMYNWVTGKDDWHDKFIKSYKDAILKKAEEDKMLMEEELERAKAARVQDDSDLQPRELRTYSKDELEKLLKARSMAVRTVSDEVVGDKHSFFKRHLVEPSTGHLKAVGGKLVPTGEGPDSEGGSLPIPEMEW